MKNYIIWAILTLISAIIPGYMLYFGKKLFNEFPDRKSYYAFKNKISMQSEEAWEYSNTKCGEIWINIGEKILPVSILTMIFSFGKSLNNMFVFFTLVIIVEIGFLIFSYFCVNKNIKEHFEVKK